MDTAVASDSIVLAGTTLCLLFHSYRYGEMPTFLRPLQKSLSENPCPSHRGRVGFAYCVPTHLIEFPYEVACRQLQVAL